MRALQIPVGSGNSKTRIIVRAAEFPIQDLTNSSVLPVRIGFC